VKTLQCDMRASCKNPVTHAGEKGWIYCATCAPSRAGWERCRKLRPWELTLLRAGIPLPSYAPVSMRDALGDWALSSETPGVARADEEDALILQARQ
jgi:hypothetical protein